MARQINVVMHVAVVITICMLLVSTGEELRPTDEFIRAAAMRSSDVYMNQLRPEYGVNFKYNGLIAHSLERMWVVLRIPLPDLDFGHETDWDLTVPKSLTSCGQGIPDSIVGNASDFYHGYIRVGRSCELCKKAYAQKERVVQSNRESLKYLVEKEFPAALPELFIAKNVSSGPGEHIRNKRFVAALAKMALGGLIPIASELISSKIRRKRNEAVVRAINSLRSHAQRNTEAMFALKQDMTIFGDKIVKNTQNIAEKVREHKLEATRRFQKIESEINKATVTMNQMLDKLHNHELYAKILTQYFVAYMNAHDRCQEMHRVMDEEMIRPTTEILLQYRKVLRSIAILGRGYLPAELVGFETLKAIIDDTMKVVSQRGGGYMPALESIHHYYDMKLVSFLVDPNSRDLVLTFPILLKPSNMDPLKLFEIETVHVPVEDADKQTQTFTRVQMSKPYIAAGSNFYIQLRIPELRMCKVIGFEFFCEELFTMKHRTKHTCESTIFYGASADVISNHCTFRYYYNATVIPSVLDGGDIIVLANMKTDKKLTCGQTQNLGVPAEIPRSSYVTVSRSFLCGCHLTTDLVTIMSSLSACDINSTTPKVLKFTVNPAFTQTIRNLSQALNATKLRIDISEEKLDTVLRSTESFTPVDLPFAIPDIRNPESLERPDTIDALVNDANEIRKELEEWNQDNQREYTDWLKEQAEKPPESLEWINRWEVIFFNCLAAVGVILVCIIVAWVIMKQSKLRALVYGYMGTNIPLSKAIPLGGEEIEPFTMPPPEPATVVCQNQYIGYVMTAISIIAMIVVAIKVLRSQTLCKGVKLRGLVTVFLTVSSDERLVRLKLKEVQAHLGLFMIAGCLNSDQVQLIPGVLRGRLHVDWTNYSILYDNKALEMPTTLKLGFFDNMRLKSIFSTNKVSAYFEIKRGDGWWIPRHSLVVPCHDDETAYDEEYAIRPEYYDLEQEDTLREGVPSRAKKTATKVTGRDAKFFPKTNNVQRLLQQEEESEL